jgi:hypothetical protein
MAGFLGFISTPFFFYCIFTGHLKEFLVWMILAVIFSVMWDSFWEWVFKKASNPEVTHYHVHFEQEPEPQEQPPINLRKVGKNHWA